MKNQVLTQSLSINTVINEPILATKTIKQNALDYAAENLNKTVLIDNFIALVDQLQVRS